MADGTRACTLMNRTHEVLCARIDPGTATFLEITEVLDPTRAPLGILGTGTDACLNLARWWSRRSIPATRPGMRERLDTLGTGSPAALAMRSLGLSLSDQYWLRPADSDLDWRAVNFFENPFTQADPADWLGAAGTASPDNATDGELPKTWAACADERKLLKGGGIYDQEPYDEVVATWLHNALLPAGAFVPYRLERFGDVAASSCPCFITSCEEYVPAADVCSVLPPREGADAYEHYLACCDALGVRDVEPALWRMIVCDDLLANTDRHWRNFGLVRNVETLECRIAPLFDSGTSLWCGMRTRDVEWADHGFVTKPFDTDPDTQLRYIRDFSWLDSAALAGLPDAAISILEDNPLLEERLDFIYEGIRRRVRYLEAVAG